MLSLIPLPIRLGAIALVIAGLVGFHLVAKHMAYRDGRAACQQEHEEARRRAEIKRDQERREAADAAKEAAEEFLTRERELENANADLQERIRNALAGRDDAACIPGGVLQ